MIKTYISTLWVVLLVAAQVARAQDGMDDVFAQLDSDADVQSAQAATIGGMESIEAGMAEQAPAIPDSEMLALLLEKGKEQYKAGDYDGAVMAFDAMLDIDEYNAAALTYRKRASRRIAAKESKKQGATRAKAIADINAKWNPEPKVLGSIEATKASMTEDPDRQASEAMIARLKAINIPVLDFTDASIEEVVLFLTEASRRNDSAGKGVNILLAGMESASGDSRVTTLITDINLFDALKVISEMASLKFEVKPHAVAIVPVNYAPVSEMVMRSYDVDPEVGADLESFSGDSGGGVDDLFGDSSSAAATGPVDVAGFFSIVDFPEGSSAIYQPRFHKLFVKNTPKNLKEMESVLADLDERALMRRAQQVEIEAKFVEFSEGSLEELGFDWNVYGSGTAAGLELDPRGVAVGVDPNTGQYIFQDGTAGDGRPGQNLMASYYDPDTGELVSTRRNNTTGFESVQGGLLSLMGGTPATMAFGNGDIDVQISAMEQEGTADVLTAPKVTTKSGSEAIIRVAETHRYPQDYDVETGQRTAPVVKPQDWEDFDLGVSLKVTPVIDPEANTIDLELQPEIVEFKGYDTYSVGFNAYKEDLVQKDKFEGENPDSTLYAEMAFFDRRLVQTQVTIADGHTVVMGGLVDERTETFRDQVPFLGDIPYLGRLFRTEGSRSSKINLTVFVKATQVDALGLTRAERELARQ